MIRHALYVASFEERPTVWLRALQPLRQAGLMRVDVTGALAPDAFWSDLPLQLSEAARQRMLEAAVPHLQRLQREVAAAGLAGAVLTAGPGEAGVFQAATLAGSDVIIVGLPRSGEEAAAEPYLQHYSPVPILFTRDRMADGAARGILVDSSTMEEPTSLIV